MLKIIQQVKFGIDEAEAAFDKGYAQALGMPIERIDFGDKKKDKDFTTIEDFYEDLVEQIDNLPKNTPGLYILDSLDALSDRAEQKRDIDEGSYNLEKAKKLGQLFRRLVQKLEESEILCYYYFSS